MCNISSYNFKFQHSAVTFKHCIESQTKTKSLRFCYIFVLKENVLADKDNSISSSTETNQVSCQLCYFICWSLGLLTIAQIGCVVNYPAQENHRRCL